MKTIKKIRGFTLVELVVTITILAILGTISLVSIQNFYGSSRDSIRITDIKSIHQGLTVFQIKTGTYPLPESPVEIDAGTGALSYQGYISDTIASLIKINKNPLDPKDTTRYTYTVNKDYKKAQLLGYLESGDTLKVTSYTDTLNHIINQVSAINTNTIDYKSRFIYVAGDKIGILTDENKTPIQESTTATGVNLSTTNSGYVAYFGGDTYGAGQSTGTGDILITQILGAQSGTIPCNPMTYSGYTVTALSHNEIRTFIKPITIANGTATGSLQVQCLNGTLDTEHALESTNISCNTTFVPQANVCVSDVCGGTVPANAQSTATGQTITQNWTYNTTPGMCTFDCKTNYTWNGTSCNANTQQALSCNGSIKPYSTDNSTATTWTQTWDGTQWLPIYTYTHNATPNICTFVCNTGYTWDAINQLCAPNNCTAPWGPTINNGNNVTAWSLGSVTYPTTCASEIRTCNNGVLSGSYVNQSCTQNYTYTWNIGAYGSCNVSCGGGTQSRTVTCLRNDGTTVADTYCTSKPATTQSCNTQACPTSGPYSYGGWGSCSVTCGGGTQTRTQSCNYDSCYSPQATSQSCNTQACCVGNMGQSCYKTTVANYYIGYSVFCGASGCYFNGAYQCFNDYSTSYACYEDGTGVQTVCGNYAYLDRTPCAGTHGSDPGTIQCNGSCQ